LVTYIGYTFLLGIIFVMQNLVAFKPLLNVLSQSVEILYEVLDVYILRCILVWPNTVKKEDIIKKLYSIVILKISDIQLRMSEILSSFKAGNFYLVTQLSVYQRIYRTANFQRHLNDFKVRLNHFLIPFGR
jgi:hypothetical protein